MLIIERRKQGAKIMSEEALLKSSNLQHRDHVLSSLTWNFYLRRWDEDVVAMDINKGREREENLQHPNFPSALPAIQTPWSSPSTQPNRIQTPEK